MTRTIRGIRSEVPVGTPHGLPQASAIACDTTLTVPKAAAEVSELRKANHSPAQS